MKRIISILLLLFISISLVSCQPSPDGPIVISKNDGKLEKAIYGGAAPELKSKYEAPETLKLELGHEDIAVHIDAKVNIPDVKKYPVYRAYPEQLTTESVKKYLDYFIGDSDIYNVNSQQRDKKTVLEDIVKYQQVLADLNDKNSDLYKEYSQKLTLKEFEEYKKNTEDFLLTLQTEYNKAPKEIKRELVPKEFVLVDKKDGSTPMATIMGWTEDNSKFTYIRSTGKPYEGVGQSVLFNLMTNGTTDEFYVESYAIENGHNKRLSEGESIKGSKYSWKEAFDIASKALTDLELDYKYCYTVQRERYNDKEQLDYQFYFTPKLPNSDLGLACYKSYQNEFSITWTAPYTIVTVGDEGKVFGYSEYSSIRYADCLNENVMLMDFDTILANANKYIVLKPDIIRRTESQTGFDQTIVKYHVFIDNISLTYMKLTEKDNPKAGLVLPVFMFYGWQEDEYKGEKVSGLELDENNRLKTNAPLIKPMFCVNAIDGSVIDLTEGY